MDALAALPHVRAEVHEAHVAPTGFSQLSRLNVRDQGVLHGQQIPLVPIELIEIVVGERPGLGQTMKLCNNLLSATALAISSEAMVLGVKAGLDPKMMLDVINTGSGRNSATQDKFPRSVLPRTFDFGFGTGLMYKDVRLCMEEAERLGVQMWVGPAVRQMWLQACMELGPESDFTAIVKCVERLAQVEVSAAS